MELLSIDLVQGPPTVLWVRGEIDLATAEQFRQALADAVAADPQVVVDLAGVTFIDASGLRALLQVAESLNGAGPLTLVHAPRVARLLELVGLRDLPSVAILEDR